MSDITFKSEFLPDVTILIVTSEDSLYQRVKPLFDMYGYGFMIPNKNMIVIDGEIILENYDPSLLKFIEAHEVAHVILGHDGPRKDSDELDADLFAYELLKKIGRSDSINILIDNFLNRHGIPFDEKMTEKFKKSYPEWVSG